MIIKLKKNANTASPKIYTARRGLSLDLSRNKDIVSFKIPGQDDATVIDLGGAEGTVTVRFSMLSGDPEDTGAGAGADIITQLSYLYDFIHGQTASGEDWVEVVEGATVRATFKGKFVDFSFSWQEGSATVAKCSIKLLIKGQMV